jgi:hypothetical protein
MQDLLWKLGLREDVLPMLQKVPSFLDRNGPSEVAQKEEMAIVSTPVKVAVIAVEAKE